MIVFKTLGFMFCGAKNSSFSKKKRKAKRILSNLGLQTPLSKVVLLGDIWF